MPVANCEKFATLLPNTIFVSGPPHKIKLLHACYRTTFQHQKGIIRKANLPYKGKVGTRHWKNQRHWTTLQKKLIVFVKTATTQLFFDHAHE
jgi:hypothetical protein